MKYNIFKPTSPLWLWLLSVMWLLDQVWAGRCVLRWLVLFNETVLRFIFTFTIVYFLAEFMYSKTCLKRSLKRRSKIGFQDRLSLNAGHQYCRMLQGEHSSILSTFIKLPFVFNTFVLSIFEWPLKTGFTVCHSRCHAVGDLQASKYDQDTPLSQVVPGGGYGISWSYQFVLSVIWRCFRDGCFQIACL